MKVVLLGEIKGKGGEGDVIDVAQGYAENYLIPQKLAVAATKGNLKQLEERRHTSRSARPFVWPMPRPSRPSSMARRSPSTPRSARRASSLVPLPLP